MANRSVFPNNLDTFIEHYDIQYQDKVNIARYQELRQKTSLTPSENSELATLTNILRDKIFVAEDFNKMQDCITNLETFFRDNVEGYISQKQIEIQSYSTNKMNDTTTFIDSKKLEIQSYVDNSVNTMEDKKNYFTSLVQVKENEIRDLVNEFDSNSARYYQTWIATTGQSQFNIFNGNNSGIPQEAKLDISEENIDFIVNGTTLTPYIDYEVLDDGTYSRIVLKGTNPSLVQNGTEVVAKWYKNVGKLYFKHASTHGEGGNDQITVTENMLETTLKSKLGNVNKRITVGTVEPFQPEQYDIFIDVR